MPPLIVPCTVSKLLDVLSDALRDPHKPTRCSHSLWAILLVIQLPNANIFEAIPSVDVNTRNRFHEALYSFIVAERTQQQLMDEMDRFKDCENTCQLNTIEELLDDNPFITPFLHSSVNDVRWSATQEQESFLAFLREQHKTSTPFHPSVGGFTMLALNTLTKLWDRRSFNSLVRGQSKEWPNNIAQLVPYGADSAASSLLQWHSAYPHHYILQFLALTAMRAGFSMHESLAKLKFMPIFLDSTKDAALILMKLVEEQKSDYSPTQVYICEKVLRQLTAFCVAIHQLFKQCYAPRRIRMALMDGSAAKIVQLATLTRCLHPVARDILSKHQSRFGDEIFDTALQEMSAICGSFVYLEFGIASAVSQSLIEDILQEEFIINYKESYEDDIVSEGELGLYYIWRHGLETGCSSASCTKTNPFLDGESKIKTCRGCLSVYYCSKECEKADWNDAEFPHKHVCPLIQKIMDGCVQLDGESATRSSKYLRNGLKRRDGLKDVRGKLKIGNLNASEVALIKGWGKTIFTRFHLEIPVDVDKWNPGYADYGSILERFMKHEKIYKPLRFAFRTYESTETDTSLQ